MPRTRSDIEPIDHPSTTPSIGGDTQPAGGGQLNSFRDTIPGERDRGIDPMDRPSRAGLNVAFPAERSRRAFAASADLPPDLDPLVLEFLNDDDSPLAVPEDDPAFAYKWIRHSLPGEGVDRRNLTAQLHGRLAWDPVRLEELPERWRETMRFMLQRDGEWSGCVVYKDLVLARTDRRRRDAYVRSLHERARIQRDQVRAGHENALRQYGGGAVRVEDSTRVGPDEG